MADAADNGPRITDRVQALEDRLVGFLRDLVAIPSLSGQEEAVVHRIADEMRELGFDEVKFDALGNVLGRIGNGPKVLAFDAHVDTVDVSDRDPWEFDPFEGKLEDGKVFGRGAVDQKAGMACMVYAGALMKELDLLGERVSYQPCARHFASAQCRLDTCAQRLDGGIAASACWFLLTCRSLAHPTEFLQCLSSLVHRSCQERALYLRKAADGLGLRVVRTHSSSQVTASPSGLWALTTHQAGSGGVSTGQHETLRLLHVGSLRARLIQPSLCFLEPGKPVTQLAKAAL